MKILSIILALVFMLSVAGQLNQGAEASSVLTKKDKKEMYLRWLVEEIQKLESGVCAEDEPCWGDNGKAYGPYQFHEASFYWMVDKLGIHKFDHDGNEVQLKWKNAKDQKLVIMEALRRGKFQSHWTTYDRAYERFQVRKLAYEWSVRQQEKAIKIAQKLEYKRALLMKKADERSARLLSPVSRFGMLIASK